MRSLIARAYLLGVLLLASCGGPSTPACSSATCGGCCTSSGRCEVNSASACGIGGGSCVACSGTDTCSAQGACVAATAECNATTCPSGCCSGNTCVTALTDNACGAAGAKCSDCQTSPGPQYCDRNLKRCYLHRVFVTSLSYEGDLKAAVPGATSGLDAADKLCSQLATGAALPGTFKAYLASGTTTAWSRIANRGPWAQQQGSVTYTEGFAAAGGSPINTITRDENQNSVGGVEIWTGARNAGSVGDTCLEWTSKAIINRGTIGSMQYLSQWTDTGMSEYCSTKRKLLCFEQ